MTTATHAPLPQRPSRSAWPTSRCSPSDEFRARRRRAGRARAAGSPRCSASPLDDGRVRLLRRAGARRRRAPCRSSPTDVGRRLPGPDARLPAGPLVRARDRRAVGRACPRDTPGSSRSASTRSYRRAATPGRGRPATDPARRHRLLPRRGRGGPRGRRGAGPRRGHRAGALPLPVPRRARLPPGDLARLPAPRGRAGAGRRAGQAHDPLHGDAGRRHVGRPRDRVLPGGRGAGRVPACRCGRRRCAAIALELERLANHTATSGRWPATSASCPRRRTAAGSAATSST